MASRQIVANTTRVCVFVTLVHLFILVVFVSKEDSRQDRASFVLGDWRAFRRQGGP